MKYLKVFKQALKNSVSYLFAYRSDFALKLFLGAGWSLTWIAMIEVFFSHTESFNGWDKNDVILVIFSFQFLEFVSIFANYLNALESDIRRGNFDFIVTKPTDTQFYATFIRPDLTNLIFFFSFQIPLLIVLIQNQTQIVWSQLPIYLVLVLCANIIWLMISTLAAMLNFWKQRLDNLSGMAWALLEYGRYPMTIFPKNLKIIFYTIFPAAFMGFVPASVLLGRMSPTIIYSALLLCLVFFMITRALWKVAVKKYSSASS